MESSNLKKTLEVLGLESFESVALDQLFTAVTQKLPSDTSKKRTLDIYVMWLHPRLMAIDVSTEGSLTQEIATWYRFLKAMATHDHLIFEAFHDWQCSQAIENPTSSRRLSIAEAELRRLMTAPSTSAKPVSDAPKAEGHFGQMHPDRVKLSRESHEVIEIDDDDDDDDDIVVISARALRDDRTSPQNNGRDRQPDLSFLTGANMLAVKDMAKAPPRKKDPEVPKTNRKSSGGSSESRPAQAKRGETNSPKIPPPYYTCDRCGQKGHFLKECPTNLDPAFDRTPPKNYKCHFCKKVGDHYGPMCPRHPQPDSIARQRREHAKALARADGGRSVDHKDRVRLARAEQYRNERPSRLDSPARGKDRSSSPTRESRRHRHGDKYRPENKYRPEDEFSRLSLSASRRQQGKRRASRSPSPHKAVSRKKSVAWVDDNVGDRHPKTRTFFDDPASQRSGQWEGRLSYDDGVDEDVPKTRPIKKRVAFSPVVEKIDVEEPKTTVSGKDEDVQLPRPAKRVAFSPVVGEMDVDDAETTVSRKTENILSARLAKRVAFSPIVGEMDVEEPATTVSEESEEDSRAEKARLFELEMMEMIRVESAKTNLLLLVEGVEVLPLCDLRVLKLFKDHKKLCFNQTVNKTRACSTDFYETDEDDESVDMADYEMVAEDKATDEEEACMSGYEADDSAVSEPDHPILTEQGDAVMVDIEPAVPVGAPATGADSTMNLAEERPVEEAKTKTGTGAIESSIDDASTTSIAAQEAAPATMDKKGSAALDNPDSPTVEPDASEVADGKSTVPSPPYPVDDRPMEVEGSVADKPVTNPVAEGMVEDKITNVEASPVPEEPFPPRQKQL